MNAAVNLATERAHIELTAAAAQLSDTDLIQTVEKAGYGANLLGRTEISTDGSRSAASDIDFASVEAAAKAAGAKRVRELRAKFWAALVLGIPIVALSMFPNLQFTGWQWLIGALAFPLGFWCGLPFHRAAFRAGKHGAATMDTLVSLGIIASLGWSYWALFFGGAGKLGYTMQMSGVHRLGAHGTAGAAPGIMAPHIYFESAAMIVTFLLLGRWLEARSRRNAGSALRALLELAPSSAYLVANADGSRAERKIPAKELTVGAVFRVNPGEKIAADGVVISGSSAIDTSLLTGESVPVEVKAGDPVTGAAINTSGTLLVRAESVGEDTQLAQMGRLLVKAQTGKAAAQRLADKISAVFVPAVIIISLLTFAVWWIFSGSFESALVCAITVLVVACPCALGLATPTALLVGSSTAARSGILISGPEVLERAHAIDTMVLDKTGTLTTGEMQVSEIRLLSGAESGKQSAAESAAGSAAFAALKDFTNIADNVTLVREISAMLEANSSHPIAQAIVRNAPDLPQKRC
ncbi:HAD-IC family P-type ATPase [Arcanobacterium hippocoleae]